jgi:hypothetical protein
VPDIAGGILAAIVAAFGFLGGLLTYRAQSKKLRYDASESIADAAATIAKTSRSVVADRDAQISALRDDHAECRALAAKLWQQLVDAGLDPVVDPE